MSDGKVSQSRTAYTLFDLLSDFGGFSDGIIMIFAPIITVYSARMFQGEISKEIPL